MLGRMRWFNELRGDGMIECEDGEPYQVLAADFVVAPPVGRCAGIEVTFQRRRPGTCDRGHAERGRRAGAPRSVALAPRHARPVLSRMRVNDDNEVRLMFHRALAGEPVVLDVRLEKLVGEILQLAEQVKLEQPEKYAAVKVWETAPGQICFLLEDAAA